MKELISIYILRLCKHLPLSQSLSVNLQNIGRRFSEWCLSMIVALQRLDDGVYYFSVVMVWSTMEVSSAILTVSIPVLRALFGVLSKTRIRRCITVTEIIWGQLVLSRFLGPQRSVYLTYMMMSMRQHSMWTGGQIGASTIGSFDLMIRFTSMLGDPRTGRRECGEVSLLGVY